MPKFRGGSDDWLDDEDGSSRSGKRKAAPAKAEPLPPENANATVTEVFPNQCGVRLDDGRETLCSYRRASIFGSSELRERAPVAVGDRVSVELGSPSSGVVSGLCRRRNFLSRVAPGQGEEKSRIHTIAANVDLLVIVASVQKPDFSPGLVDRYLIAAQAAGIEPLLCVTKIDLALPEPSAPWEVYRELGYSVAEVSAKAEIGIEDLKSWLSGKTTVFCGHSGVGKTSLLRTLLGFEVGRVGDVSEITGKGRHTTTGAVMFRAPDGSGWIDTPGIREFGLIGIEPERLAAYFPEFRALGCDQAGCLHSDEQGCKAREFPRYSTYRRILDSLRQSTA